MIIKKITIGPFVAVAFLPLLSSAQPGCQDRKSVLDEYSVRGVVVKIEPGEDHAGRLTLLHEKIPDFRGGRDGSRVGMEAMLMTFDAAPSAPLESLKPQDKVSIRFEVDWKKSPPVRIVKIEKLDPQVKLDLGGYSLEP